LRPLGIGRLRGSRQRVGPLERRHGARQAVLLQPRLGVLATPLGLLLEGPRAGDARPALCRPKRHLLTEALAEKLRDTAHQAVPRREGVPGRLLEGPTLVVRAARTVDQTDCHPHPTPDFVHASLNHRSRVECPRNAIWRRHGVAIGAHTIAGSNDEWLHAAQVPYERFGEAVREVAEVPVA